MSAPVEIRNSTTGKLFPALAPFLLAGLFGFFMLQGLSPSSITSGRVVLLMAVLALCCLGIGLFMARGIRDTSVQVVLDANGFRDRRRGDVLVPWAKRAFLLCDGRAASPSRAAWRTSHPELSLSPA